MRRVIVCLAIALLARPAAAQRGIGADCTPALVTGDTVVAWRALRPDSVRARLAPFVDSLRWSRAASELVAVFATPPANLDALPPADRRTIALQLDSLADELRAIEADPTRLARGLVAQRFTLAFDDDPAPRYTLFDGRVASPVVLTDATPSAARRTVCRLAYAAADLVGAAREPGLARLAAAFARVDSSWDNFMRRGYSMLPLELWVNGKLPRPTLQPPPVQLVLGHVSAGEQMSGPTWNRLRRDDVLAVEPLGILRYGGNHAWYAGASSVVTFPRTGGVGVGVMLHASRFGRAAWILTPRDSTGRRRSGVLLTLDLYGRLVGVAEQWKAFKVDAERTCRANAQACIAAVVPR